MSSRLHFHAAVFDLDGVITDTARLHAAAWQELIDGVLEMLSQRSGEPHEPFDADRDYRRYVDGKPRQEGLESFLRARGIELPHGDPDDAPGTETIWGLAGAKDEIFQQLLDEEGVELMDGTMQLIETLRDLGVRTAVASSSRNCRRILERAGIEASFDARVDGETLRDSELRGKPHPDMFQEALRRLEVDPADGVVFEDAVAGVIAGARTGFGLVVGVAGDATTRVPLREAGAHLVWPAEAMEGLSPDLLNTWFVEDQHRRPPVLGSWKEFRATLGDRRPAVFLDYDGTLTPIVSRPEQATLSEDMRRAVQELARRFPTTIVSGRGLADVMDLVGLDDVHYAGSHGFDIRTAGGTEEVIRHEAAADVEPLIQEVTRHLENELADIEGALVEPKRFTVAVHVRLVTEEDAPRVEAAVDEAVKRAPELAKARGKMVYEIRPALDWDKGRAVLWLLDALELNGPRVVPIYLGDDTTDEDAFRVLEERGVGIVVTDRPRPTHAHYQLQDPDEVEAFLRRLGSL